MMLCYSLLFFVMIRRPPRSTRTDTLFPYTTRFRSRERVAVDRLGSVDLEIGGQTGAALREVDPRHEDAERLEIGGIRQAEIIVCGVGQCRDRHLADVARADRKSTRLNSSH